MLPALAPTAIARNCYAVRAPCGTFRASKPVRVGPDHAQRRSGNPSKT